MELNKFINRLKNSLTSLWHHKIFRIAILVNFFFLILSLTLTLTVFRNRNDFLVYYSVGEVFINDIRNQEVGHFSYSPQPEVLFIVKV